MQDQQISLISYTGAYTSKSAYPSIISNNSLIDLNFYYKFLELNSLLQVQIEQFQTIEGDKLFSSSYVVYSIRIITDYISYIVKRRYSQFLGLYNKLAKFYDFNSSFPKKTLFSSKISTQTSENRMFNLNLLIQQILKQSKQNQMVIVEFLSFLDLINQYKSHNIFSIIIDKLGLQQQSQLSISYSLSHQMLKLNRRREYSLNYLKTIEDLIVSNRKSKLKMEDLKQVLLGNKDMMGLIQFALITQNQLVGVSFLKTLHRLFNLEICCYSQACKRIFQNIPTASKKLKIKQQNLFDSQQFMEQYFKLVEIYLQNKSAQDKKTFFKSSLNQVTINKYNQWKSLSPSAERLVKRATSYDISKDIVRTKSDSISRVLSYNLVEDIEIDQDINPLDRFQLAQKEFTVLHCTDSNQFEVSQDLKIVHIHLRVAKITEKIGQYFKSWKYNQLVSSIYEPKNNFDEIISLNIRAPRKQPKIFKLRKILKNRNIDEQKNNQEDNQKDESPKRSTETMDSARNNSKYYRVIYQPLKEDYPQNKKRQDGFFYSLQIIDKHEGGFINISFQFNRKSVIRYFNSELTGKTSILWDGIIKVLNSHQQIQINKIANEKIIEGLEPISERSSNIQLG